MPSWSIFRKRRLTVAIVTLVVIYYFVKYLPTDLPTAAQRIDPRTGHDQTSAFSSSTHARPQQDHLDSGQLYDGPVSFPSLALSLRPHLQPDQGGRPSLVFLFRDLRAAGALIATACDTALYQRTIVHLVIISQQDTPISDVLAVNRIEHHDCPAYWHDARPNLNARSSNARQAITIKSIVGHLHATLQPSALVVDERQMISTVFAHLLQQRSDELSIPLVVVPDDALTSMSWLTSLDGPGWARLNNLQVDLVITPFRHSAGSLLKLLESIKSANYAGLPWPRITVELPQKIDPFALSYLEQFRWPSHPSNTQSKLVLRRRLESSDLSPLTASLRTLESFYPANRQSSHVLVLSPDVELSPDYLHYLLYTALEYKSGTSGARISGSLMGISLHSLPELPAGKGPVAEGKDPVESPLYLSHRPSSTAALYFGEKWIELQEYLTLRLKHDPTLSTTVSDRQTTASHEPTWLTLASEFMQARNYVMLYPTTVHNPESQLITIHQELHQDPEEFAALLEQNQASRKSDPIPVPTIDETTVLVADKQSLSSHARLGHSLPVVNSRPIRGRLSLKDREPLPVDSDLPLFTIDGKPISHHEAKKLAEHYADDLSLTVGGCKALDQRNDLTLGRIDDLFC